jgi:hypothetical protein
VKKKAKKGGFKGEDESKTTSTITIREMGVDNEDGIQKYECTPSDLSADDMDDFIGQTVH